MIENRFFLKTLLRLGKFSDQRLMLLFNRFVGYLYLLILPRILMSLDRSIIKIIPRHSVLESHFNPFFSDFDFSIIIENQERSKIIANKLYSLRQKFPFIGEAEIYLPDEFSRLVKIRSQDEQYFMTIHLIRKISWSAANRARAISDYHKYKATRSNLILFRKLEISNSTQITERVSELLQERFAVELAEIEVSHLKIRFIFSHFLAREVELDVKENFLLLALIPGYFNYPEDLNEKLREIRKKYENVRKLHSSHVGYEILMFKGYSRAQFGDENWMVDWLDKLNHESQTT